MGSETRKCEIANYIACACASKIARVRVIGRGRELTNAPHRFITDTFVKVRLWTARARSFSGSFLLRFTQRSATSAQDIQEEMATKEVDAESTESE